MSATAGSSPPSTPSREEATLGGGCFWCTEAVFTELQGVERVVPGYAGGHTVRPTYEEVCTGTTGHAEVIEVTFDPRVLSYHDLLTVFFSVHDPTTLNRQGADAGTQYRSVILYHSPEQQKTAEATIRELESARLWPRKYVTQLAPFVEFYPAEEYHRDYFARNPAQAYCQMVVAPKVAKFRKHFVDRLKSRPLAP
ncbi:MAG: peptide-methionine (S)-S-oxide reductase MsrA [Thermoplasmata archaeon]